MPHFKFDGTFPGESLIPEPARHVLDSLFGGPPDPSDLSPIGMASGPIKGLLKGSARPSKAAVAAVRNRGAMPPIEEALLKRPQAPAELTKNTGLMSRILQQYPKSIDMAPIREELWPPPGFVTADPATQEVVHLLRKLPSTVDLDKMAAMERVTAKRPPVNTVEAPKGFYFGQPKPAHRPLRDREMPRQLNTSRDPLVDEMAKRYHRFDYIQDKQKRHSTAPKAPPALSGRWAYGNARRVAAQKTNLTKDYKKP